jgi:O-antigen/teichoic acid export membrane protein
MQNKLTTDILWTLGSFFVLAVSGIVVNAAIAGLRDATALGVFNQSYAIYIIASQFAVAGLHYSVMRHAAIYSEQQDVRSTMLASALMLCLAAAISTGCLLYAAAEPIGRFLDSQPAADSVPVLSLALPAYAASKVLIGYLNGLRHMRAFALLQALRYSVLMAVAVSVAASDLPNEMLACCFLAAEVATAVSAAAYIAITNLALRPAVALDWIRRHISFGTRSFVSGVLMETNSRIDILTIGYFLTDRSVGIYSFVGMLFDGLYQFLTVVRTNFNPILVTASHENKWTEAIALRTLSAKYVMPATAGLACALAIAFWGAAHLLLPGRGLEEGFASLVILLSALSLLSVLLPFENLLMLNGYPGTQTLQYCTIALCNIVVGVFLVPRLGIEGAAIAAALSNAMGVVFLVFFVQRLLRWNLASNVRAS